ncbi:carbamate kinase [Candidatus Woesearchaeota archaeon]|jgi:carbamate kinase|nr:carbamate kinase [Candidatus Woesearchaeota archaeon]MBT3438673.1 carbamate kinase [Candidatus Woesearchaeota archaeon]MBT4058587.1 carbamate kinase [Candidatus Woesearchaeota archaeon]MBT4207015.1 carbamate kinase [Candidatus Woesearchaeota archaeon]MBT4733316.1 carbamate kinase [Candidatus Woesearchaeota archaeon]
MKKGETIVIALGGNSLLKKGQKPTINNQFKNTKETLTKLIPLIKSNKIVITHGNGFQVGNILIRVEESLGKAYSIPLEICVAESQGEIGYMIEQNLQNILQKNQIKKPVVSVLTQVIVNKKDPAFKDPTKPIGPFYTKTQATKLKKKGFKVVNQIGRGYRKVVPSPKPISIDDVKIIQALLEFKSIVIAAGGGGVPVIKENNLLKGVPAVIDKDLASACLANSLKAKTLIILMEEASIYSNYKKKNQKPIRKLTLKEAKELQPTLPKGSVGPKIQAAINFIKKGGSKVIITSASKLKQALIGKAGTTITI